MIILGIDPGTAIVGYGVISTTIPKHLKQDRNQKPKVLDFGCITTTQFNTAPERLKIIHEEVCALIKKHQPDKVGIESVIYFDTYGNNKKDLSLFLWDISDYTQKLIEKAQHKIHKVAHPQIEKLKHHVKAFFGKEDKHKELKGYR